MYHLHRVVPLLSFFLMVGCGSSDSDKNKASNEITPSKGVNILTKQRAYLTDMEGKALYTFAKDSLNKSECDTNCQQTWPTFLGNKTSNDITKVPNSEAHLAYKQHPLYYFSSDESVGDIKGSGINGVWNLVFPYPSLAEQEEVKLSTTMLTQHYLTDKEGIALYYYDLDGENLSNCYDDDNNCETLWPVFYIENFDNLPDGLKKEDFGTITRDSSRAKEGESLKQTTYKGRPLYYYIHELNNKEIGEIRCDWGDGVWHLIEIDVKK